MRIASKIALAVLISVAAGTAAEAQDYYGGASLSQFEGFYVGAQGGAVFMPGTTAGAVGAMAGANFSVTDGFLVGAEAQGDVIFGPTWTGDALMLGRVGYEINDMTMLYGAAGGGLSNGAGVYALGGGGEVILVDQIGARAEILGTGNWGGGLNGAKATAGVLFHMK